VLLISGSGPQDRNQTVFGHRTFLVLADYLTRRGVAVLRVDDRGVGGSTGTTARANSKDLAGDALAGIAYLKGRKEVDAGRIGLIGHSEGGLIASLVASESNGVAFVVLLAAPGVKGKELMYLQGETILRAAGASREHIAWHRALQARIFEVLEREANDEAARKQIGQLLAAEFAQLGGDGADKAVADLKAAAVEQARRAARPHVRFALTYDPGPVLEQVHCPVLALAGERDVQVPPRENLRGIAAALRAGGNRNCTVKEVPKLNHLLQTCGTGAVSEYGKIEETLAPAALELIGDWVLKRAGRVP
jgi:pimeloyl-ACP methyl ester carboxylesterase